MSPKLMSQEHRTQLIEPEETILPKINYFSSRLAV